MLSDMAKGALPVLVASLLRQPAWVEVVVALAAVAGHIWPIFNRFRGGKGVATAYGALLVLMPWAAVVAIAIGLPIMAATRYVSLGALLGSLAGFVVLVALALVLGPWESLIFGSLALGVILWRHRDNIRRLRAGTELRLDIPKAPAH
jgi:glycerol-3-phosphate acyltransferase PlsY